MLKKWKIPLTGKLVLQCSSSIGKFLHSCSNSLQDNLYFPMGSSSLKTKRQNYIYSLFWFWTESVFLKTEASFRSWKGPLFFFRGLLGSQTLVNFRDWSKIIRGFSDISQSVLLFISFFRVLSKICILLLHSAAK